MSDEWSLTGKWSFTSSLFGKVLLIVEERKPHWSDNAGKWTKRWRKANKYDHAELFPVCNVFNIEVE